MTERAFSVNDRCPACSVGRLRVCRRRADRKPFIGCSRYPTCSHVEAYDTYLQELLGRLHELQAAAAFSSLHSSTAPDLGAIDSKLRDLIFRVHPDRNHDGVDPSVVVVALNELRASIRRAA